MLARMFEIKQKEKMKDHHRGESAARSDSFG